jgi:hypothetical protein
MGTVMFGRRHDQPGILVEPKEDHAIDVEDPKQLSELRNKFWWVLTTPGTQSTDHNSRPIIDEANRVAPEFDRIFKEMILITSKDKPLPRTGKDTVMRKMALKAYDDEIEVL